MENTEELRLEQFPHSMQPWPTFSEGEAVQQMVCPLCPENGGTAPYVHVEDAYAVSGHDRGTAWAGRGNCLRVQFWAECGHAWELCFGFHKGDTGCFGEEVPVLHSRNGADTGDALKKARRRTVKRSNDALKNLR